MSMANVKQLVAFGWRTLSVAVLVVDYFLFVTGNPSFTYSLLGGWFIVPLFAATFILASYGLRAYRENGDRRLFLVHSGVVVSVSVVLFLLSGEARQHAIEELDSEVIAFANDPKTSKLEASEKTRVMMADIKNHPYSMRFDTFIPTFRRIDYKLETEAKRMFLLVAVVKWNGVLTVSLLTQED